MRSTVQWNISFASKAQSPPSCITTAIRPAPASVSTMRSSMEFPDPGSSRTATSSASMWGVHWRVPTATARPPSLRNDLPEAQDLIDVTRQSFFEGIKFAKEGYRLFDISAAIQQYVESHGYSIVREYVGHGVGARCTSRRRSPTTAIPAGDRAAPRHDACNRTHGECRLRSHQADARRLDRQDAGWQMGRPLREFHSDHRRRAGDSHGSRHLRGTPWKLQHPTS